MVTYLVNVGIVDYFKGHKVIYYFFFVLLAYVTFATFLLKDY